MRLGILFFFFNDTATTEIYTLSLHDALPIDPDSGASLPFVWSGVSAHAAASSRVRVDRQSPRLNSSHITISYAVFCLKKKTRIGRARHTEETLPKPPTYSAGKPPG